MKKGGLWVGGGWICSLVNDGLLVSLACVKYIQICILYGFRVIAGICI